MENTLQDERDELINKDFEMIFSRKRNPDIQNNIFGPGEWKDIGRTKLNKDLQLVWNLDKLSFTD